MKGLSLAGHVEVPRGLRTGDHSNTADGSGNLGRPALITGRNREKWAADVLFSLLEGSTSDWHVVRPA